MERSLRLEEIHILYSTFNSYRRKMDS